MLTHSRSKALASPPGQALSIPAMDNQVIGRGRDPESRAPLRYDQLRRFEIVCDVQPPPSERSSEFLPVACPGACKGFGDLRNTVELAEQLAPLYPERKPLVIFPHEDDIAKLSKIRTTSVQCLAMDEAERAQFLSSCDLAILSPIPALKQDYSGGYIGAEVSIYLDEYNLGPSQSYALPKDLRSNSVSVDQHGNQHILLRSGLGIGKSGIHIDRKLGSKSPADAYRELLDALEVGRVLDTTSPFQLTMAYCERFHEQIFRSLFTRGLDRAQKHIKEDILVIDFLPVTYAGSDFMKYCRNTGFNHYLRGEDGSYKTLHRKKGASVHVLHVGTQPHSVLLNAMAAATLPIMVTGDGSLSEAISMGKLFFYEPPAWKSPLEGALTECAEQYLPFKDVELMYALKGISEPLVTDSQALAAFEAALDELAPYMGQLYDVMKESSFELKVEKAVAGFEDIPPKSRSFLTQSRQSYPVLCAIYAFRDTGSVPVALAAGRNEFVYGCGTYDTRKARPEKLFLDPETQKAFIARSAAIIEDYDLVRNIKPVIDDALAAARTV